MLISLISCDLRPLEENELPLEEDELPLEEDELPPEENELKLLLEEIAPPPFFFPSLAFGFPFFALDFLVAFGFFDFATALALFFDLPADIQSIGLTQ
ncbi:MAG: hypothetical protein LBH49_03285 [Puniceicoccales bacterium]|jgi:hypothetical protein|nr:hypothetical protein [Puniceicoccales bacterium]